MLFVILEVFECRNIFICIILRWIRKFFLFTLPHIKSVILLQIQFVVIFREGRKKQEYVMVRVERERIENESNEEQRCAIWKNVKRSFWFVEWLRER